MGLEEGVVEDNVELAHCWMLSKLEMKIDRQLPSGG